MAKKTNTSKSDYSMFSRRSLNDEELFQKIQQRAYQLFEKRGYNHGNDINDWLEAERMVRAELRYR